MALLSSNAFADDDVDAQARAAHLLQPAQAFPVNGGARQPAFYASLEAYAEDVPKASDVAFAVDAADAHAQAAHLLQPAQVLPLQAAARQPVRPAALEAYAKDRPTASNIPADGFIQVTTRAVDAQARAARVLVSGS